MSPRGPGLNGFFLADGRHPGPLGQGLIAGLLIEVVRTEFAAGIGPLEPREGLAVARWVAPSRDADVGRAGLAGAPRPGSPVKPAAGRTENVPTGAANR
jgi:hypothetical protein